MAPTPAQPNTPSPPAVFSKTVEGFLANLADRTPTPGGGAAAALSGATAAALAQMVTAYALNTQRLATHHADLQQDHDALTRFRHLFLQLGEEDAAAYAVLNAAFKLSKEDPARQSAITAAAIDACAPPRAVLAAATDLLARIATLPPRTSKSLHSDLAVAAALADSAAIAAAWNIRANLPLLPQEQAQDPATGGSDRARVSEHTRSLLGRAAALRADIEQQCGATS